MGKNNVKIQTVVETPYLHTGFQVVYGVLKMKCLVRCLISVNFLNVLVILHRPNALKVKYLRVVMKPQIKYTLVGGLTENWS